MCCHISGLSSFLVPSQASSPRVFYLPLIQFFVHKRRISCGLFCKNSICTSFIRVHFVAPTSKRVVISGNLPNVQISEIHTHHVFICIKRVSYASIPAVCCAKRALCHHTPEVDFPQSSVSVQPPLNAHEAVQLASGVFCVLGSPRFQV